MATSSVNYKTLSIYSLVTFLILSAVITIKWDSLEAPKITLSPSSLLKSLNSEKGNIYPEPNLNPFYEADDDDVDYDDDYIDSLNIYPKPKFSTFQVIVENDQNTDMSKNNNITDQELAIFEDNDSKTETSTPKLAIKETIVDCTARLGKKGEFEVVPLVSLPGAGNTWVRFLIEQATGILTGSVYNDGSLYRVLKGERRPMRDRETIVVKSHVIGRVIKHMALIPDMRGKPLRGCVTILRNPVNAALAEYTRHSVHSHTGHVNYSEEMLQKFDGMARNFAVRRFFGTYAGVDRECHGDQFIIIYEEIKDSHKKLEQTLIKLVEYLNEKNPNNPPLKYRKVCVDKNQEGSFHRSAKRDFNILDYLSVDTKANINRSVQSLNETFNGRIPEEYKIEMPEWVSVFDF